MTHNLRIGWQTKYGLLKIEFSNAATERPWQHGSRTHYSTRLVCGDKQPVRQISDDTIEPRNRD